MTDTLIELYDITKLTETEVAEDLFYLSEKQLDEFIEAAEDAVELAKIMKDKKCF